MTARICGNEYLFFIDGVKFAVGRLVSRSDGSYTAIISPFHSIVPGQTAALEPSITRVILATLCPFAIKAPQANRALLPTAVSSIAADQIRGPTPMQQGVSDSQFRTAAAAGPPGTGPAIHAPSTFSHEALSSVGPVRARSHDSR